MTPVSDSVFNALSHGSLGLVLHGSPINLHCKDSYWLLKNFDQSENGWKSYHGKQNQGYHVKEHKNWIRKWCHKWVYILFGVTYPKNKQWGGRSTNFCILFVWSGIYCMAGPGQETAKLNAIEEGCKQRTSNLLYPIQRTGMTVTRSLYLGIFFHIT